MSISIHAPRAGSDRPPHQQPPSVLYFNPCSPCGERLSVIQFLMPTIQFQSMLPVRGATCARLRDREARIFQSMLPVRGATSRLPNGIALSTISIHAPRAGSDICLKAFTFDGYNFNPCSPCGERLRFAENQQICFLISIHAPRAGSDYLQVLLPHQPRQFQSMLPVRGATFLPLCQGT